MRKRGKNGPLFKTFVPLGRIPNGTNVCFDVFLWSSPSTCLPICLRPGRRGGRKQIGRQWKVSLCLVAPPQAAAEYGINSSFC